MAGTEPTDFQFTRTLDAVPIVAASGCPALKLRAIASAIFLGVMVQRGAHS